MADIQNQKVIGDTGSEELKLLRKSYNALLVIFGTYLDAIEAAGAVGNINAAATAALLSLEATTTVAKSIGAEKELVDAPKFPNV